jgi:antitoxin component YwqK of YwqJK toxin-antitoxin module
MVENNLLEPEIVDAAVGDKGDGSDQTPLDFTSSFESFEMPKSTIPDGVQQFENDDSVTYITFKDGKKNGLLQIVEQGRLSMDMMFVDDLLNGPFKYYFSNKAVQLTMQYKDGKLHGDFIQFHPNGVVQMKTTYINGLQQGVSQTFNAQNILVQDASYKDGLLEGPMNTYHEGQLIGRTYYKEGVEVMPKV